MLKNNIQKYEDSINIIIIGDTNVGKTTLMKRYINDKFSENIIPSLGIELYRKIKEINGKKYLIKIWDTCGQERFKALTQNYYRNADGVMILFDSNNIKSFQNLNFWLNSLKEYSSKNYPLIIIGYFFSGYHVVYLNINKNNDIIKEEIKKNKNNIKKLTFILKEKEICKICNTETNQIMFLKKKFICCQKCLNEFMDSIIDKRLKFFEEDSYFGIEYYSRRIKLQNEFYIDNDEIIEV